MHVAGPFSEGAAIPDTPYEVVRLVGVGETSFVYEVCHTLIGKLFVLKTLQPGAADREDLVARLRAEWRALGKLEHPHIVSVSDAGLSGGSLPYLVMERLVGQTLEKRLLGQVALPVAEALGLAQQMLEGLAAAHGVGIVHGDVKPANVFLTDRGDVKLLDFGLARVVEKGGDSDQLFGTPRYMSPEQASGGLVGAQTDLYSVGLILFEMLAGRAPFDAETGREWLLCHLRVPAPACSALAEQGIPREVDDLVAALLAKDPRRRPEGARAAADALAAMMVSVAPAVEDNANTLIDVFPVFGADAEDEAVPAEPSLPAEIATDEKRRTAGWRHGVVAAALIVVSALALLGRRGGEVAPPSDVKEDGVLESVAPPGELDAMMSYAPEPGASGDVKPVASAVPSEVKKRAPRPGKPKQGTRNAALDVKSGLDDPEPKKGVKGKAPRPIDVGSGLDEPVRRALPGSGL